MSASFGIGLLCTTRSLGGIELNVLRLAGWMRERGHRCLVIGVDEAPLLRRADELDLPWYSVGDPPKYGALGAARRLGAKLVNEGYSSLMLNATKDLNLGVLTRAASRQAIHLIHTQHMQFGAKKTDLLHRLQHAKLDAWIAPLPWLAEQTRTHTTLPPGRIHVIPFGIDLSRLSAKPDRDTAREHVALPREAFVAGVVGRLDRGKGQEYLIRAAALLRERGIVVHVLIVGEETRGEDQGYAQELRTLTEQLSLQEHVHFRGFLEHVEDAYAAMDCFVLPSLSETFGMVTIEAMAAGLPVIGTNTAGTPDIIRDDVTGLLVSPRSAGEIADQLQRLIHDAELRDTLAAAGCADAHARFSHREQCARIEQLLERIHPR